MKRDPALQPLTHDHHHALVQARRLRLAAAGEKSQRSHAAEAFIAFFDAETINHFREEEELLLPLMVEAAGSVPPLVEQVLTEHVELHTLVLGLRRGDPTEELMREVARRLESHIRLEEKEVFPLAEQTVAAEALAGLHFAPRNR
ncbi:MAG TPA: hemerythrin domain-containing protein [Actinomycetota bacterium]|nr:hemerythrin domain-containing protein [Actinomycetota bacterium]